MERRSAPTLRFLGAVGTVTGSRYLVEYGRQRLLVDCGLFQGYKQLRERNWIEFPVRPDSIDAVLLTHAHLDHSGYLPRLIRNGFRGKVLCTPATRDLCSLLLRDSGHLQEEEARVRAEKGFSKHANPTPLYTLEDAEAALERLVVHDFDTEIEMGPEIRARFHYAGHLLGAAQISLEIGGRIAHFSGDLGRAQDPMMRPPVPLQRADVLVWNRRTATAGMPVWTLSRNSDRSSVALSPGAVWWSYRRLPSGARNDCCCTSRDFGSVAKFATCRYS